MKNKQSTRMAFMQGGLILALAAGALAGQAGSAASPAKIDIEYKMDPRITKGLYMGERWITPPTYISTADSVEIRANGVDAKGAAIAIRPQWIASDPEMVAVTPGEGSQVTVAVKRAGESRLKITAGDVSKELVIKAETMNTGMRVEIAQAAEPAASPAFKGEREKLSYALGMSLVSQMRNQGVQLDTDSYVQGFRDALSGGKTLLTEAEATSAVMEMQSAAKSRQAKTLKELAEKNHTEGEGFLRANRTKEGVVTLESGLQYKILNAGDGKKPSLDDTVVCNYRGTLINGTEFDSSYKRGKPASFPVKQVIKGWTEALQLMPAGSKWQLFVPSQLAYGTRGAGGAIGPNTTLIFEVELISIQGGDAAAARENQ